MARERFWWEPSLDLLRDSRNGALWLEHWASNRAYRNSAVVWSKWVARKGVFVLQQQNFSKCLPLAKAFA